MLIELALAAKGRFVLTIDRKEQESAHDESVRAYAFFPSSLGRYKNITKKQTKTKRT